jgi:hypothetical protein
MHKALLIGIGNIGAFYDINKNQVLTYAKALSLNKNFIFSIFDTDKKKCNLISKKYNCSVVNKLTPKIFDEFELVIIATPTNTHFDYLKILLKSKCKIIVCEKPILKEIDEIVEIEKLYNKYNKKIIINFHRRFQSKIIKFKSELKVFNKVSPCNNIIIKYQRGVNNNFSHALDLIEFITEEPIKFINKKIITKNYDEFNDDPTLSFCFKFKNCNFFVIGLNDSKFSLFEIEFYFKNFIYKLLDGCNTIEMYKISNNGSKNKFYDNPKLVYSHKNQIKNYMKDVLISIQEAIENENYNDNFQSSINISKKILTL